MLWDCPYSGYMRNCLFSDKIGVFGALEILHLQINNSFLVYKNNISSKFISNFATAKNKLYLLRKI